MQILGLILMIAAFPLFGRARFALAAFLVLGGGGLEFAYAMLRHSFFAAVFYGVFEACFLGFFLATAWAVRHNPRVRANFEAMRRALVH